VAADLGQTTGTPTFVWPRRYRRYGSGALQPSVAVHSLAFLGGTSTIATSGATEHIHVAWENWATDEEIVAAASADGGGSWQLFNVTSYGAGNSGQAKTPVLTRWGAPGGDDMMLSSWRATANQLYQAQFSAAAGGYGPNTPTQQAADNSYAVETAVYGTVPQPVSVVATRNLSPRDAGL